MQIDLLRFAVVTFTGINPFCTCVVSRLPAPPLGRLWN